MKIAVEGCAHGELDKIYETIKVLEEKNHIKVDLLIICGDFQAVRNPADLQCMAVPPKYRKMNTFYKYYSGAEVAPVLTVFIGGNHEASNYLSELPYGGWVCPNIYYLGYANVLNIGGIRIAGLSGIYKARDYFKGHFECPPYDGSSQKSVYHVRNLEVFRLKQIKQPIDVFISHDWPTGVYNFGNKEEILKWKPFFKNEMNDNTLGSQPAEELLLKLKPCYWFSAHLHCKFAAIVPHDNGKKFTKFLALDKCLPRRKFLQVLDIESKSETVHIEYDVEWLAILRSTNHLLNVSKRNVFMPGPGCSERWDFTPSSEEIEDITMLFNENFRVPENFSQTAPSFNPSVDSPKSDTLKPYINPQTEVLCNILNITDPLITILNKSSESLNISEFSNSGADLSSSFLSSTNPDEIELSDEELNATENSKPDLDVSDCNDFFIDKIGSSLLHSQNTCSSPKTSNSSYEFPEIKEENLVVTNKRSSSENPIKFKRRNYELYKSEDT